MHRRASVGVPIAEQLGEHHAVVVLLVASGVDDRHRTLACTIAPRIDLINVDFNSLRYQNSGKRAGTWLNQRRSASLAAKSRAHSSSLARSRETPRGHTWSTSTR